MAEENTEDQEQIPRTMPVARIRKTRSGVWEHFTRFTADDEQHKAECKRCHQVLGANTRNGTSTLWTHLRICKSQDVAPAAARAWPPHPRPRSGEPSHNEPAGLEEDEATGDLARMIALHGYDSSIVEDGYFRSFVRRLSPEFKLPSRLAVDEMCDGVFDETRSNLFSRLRSALGRISLAVGKARTVEGEVLYIACHAIDAEWKLQKVVVDASMIKPSPYYHGELLGVCEVSLDDVPHHVTEFISERGIHDRLFMMATDDAFDLQLKDCRPKIISRTDPAAREVVICTPTNYVYMDNVLHSIAPCLDPGCSVLFSNDIICTLWDLNLTRQRRQQLLSHIGLDDLWRYHEPWYLCFCSLEVLRKEGSSTIGDLDFCIEILCKIWGEIHRAIQRISAFSCPTSNLCLAELFKLREILQSEMARASGDHADIDEKIGIDAVQDVLRVAQDTLDKAIQDSYLIWSIPLVLDPRYKLEFVDFLFRRAFGSEAAGNYISEVTRKLKSLYTDYSENGGATAMDISSADPLEQAWNAHIRLQLQDGILGPNNHLETETELNRYLKDRLVPPAEGFDILNWWKVCGSDQYPTVAQMARDALAMPTCSKLSSEQIAHVRSMVRGYSKKGYYQNREMLA